MKAWATFIFILLALAGQGQNSINHYKYVIVPQRFDFSKEDDQYGLSTSTKLLLDQKGFVAYVGNTSLPQELAANKCHALMAEVVQRKSFFTTILTLILKDCQGNILFKSKEGKSREKEFPIAYDAALKDAFSSLNDLPYKYDSTQAAQEAEPPVLALATASVSASTGTLYAQPTVNGYQLVDMTPKKIMQLLKTSIPDYFIARAGASGGVVFKKDGAWIFEYYKDEKLVSQTLEIKF